MDTSVVTHDGPAPAGRVPHLLTGGLYAGAGAMVAVAVALGVSADTSVPLVAGLLRGAIVAAPLTAAAYAFREPAFVRFGRLLLAVGVVSFLSTLAESPDATLYTIGRLAGWGVEALLVLLVLSFPSGRLESRLDRVLAAGMGGIIVFLLLTTGLASPTFPVPSPWTSCIEGCPPNALSVADHPAFGFNPLVVTSLLLFVVLLTLVVRLQQRCDTARGLRRQMLLPLVVISIARAALVGCGFAWRAVDSDSGAVEACSWLIAVITPLVSVAFLVGLVRMRLFTENAVVRLARQASRPTDARALQREFARAFADPTIEIVFPAAPGATTWIDLNGRPITDIADADRHVHVIRDRDGTPLAGLLCASTLAEHPALLDAGASIASVALDNVRLATDAADAARELRGSRARIAAAADDERRRIERDLHDGAQQRLVALRIELGLVEDLVRSDPEGCIARVRELELNIDAALEELRSLAHGVRPPLLADRGLAEALAAAMAAAPLRVSLRTVDVRRYPPEVESAVYFCVLEAVQNVAKHARGATHADVRLDGAGRVLRFSVHDDGPGTPGGRLVAGMGVTNMEDRMGAVGGRLVILSQPGQGTTVLGELPPRR
jgi:signal transduction histidine kinase